MQVTISTTIMVPVVVGLAWVFRHRPSVQHTLWVVVLLKFVTPPIVSLPVPVPMAIKGWFNPSADTNDSLPSKKQNLKSIETEFSSESDMVFDIPYDASGASRYSENTALAAESVQPFDTSAVSKRLVDPGAAQRAFIIGSLFAAWLTGTLFIAMRHVRQLSRQLRLLRGASPANHELKQCVIEVAQHLHVRPLLTLVVSGIGSPFVWCLGQLRLVWPLPMAKVATDRASKIIIAHELSHVRRGDHWIAWLEMIAGLIWWWNPVYWFVRSNIRVTAEMSCDALALAAYPNERSTYAEALFALSVSKTGAPPLVLAVGGGAPSSLERRIRMMMSEHVSGKLSLPGFLTVALLAIAAIPALSFAQDGGDEAFGKQPTTSNRTFVADPVPDHPKSGSSAADVPIDEARNLANEDVRFRKTETKSAQDAPQPEEVRFFAGDNFSFRGRLSRHTEGETGVRMDPPAAGGASDRLSVDLSDIISVDLLERRATKTITEKTIHRLKAMYHAALADGRVDDAKAIQEALDVLGLPQTEATVSGRSWIRSLSQAEHSPLALFRDYAPLLIRMRITGGNDGAVWGSDSYTDDSSIAAAAVHAGIAKLGESVEIELTTLGPANQFTGREQNGIVSMYYGDFPGAFRMSRVTDNSTAAYVGSRAALRGNESAFLTLNMLSGQAPLKEGTIVVVPLHGKPGGAVIGDEVYASDYSSLDAAAVHAGILKPDEFGLVKVIIEPGKAAYTGKEKNGVSSSAFGESKLSFRLESVPRANDSPTSIGVR